MTIQMGEISSFDPGEIPTPGSFHVEPPKDPRSGASFEEALGLDPREIEAPVDPDVQRFLDTEAGKAPEQAPSDQTDLQAQLKELVEQNRRLAGQLGKQGNEVVGPLRAENQQLAERLAKLEQGMHGGESTPNASQTIEQAVLNLYGPNADPRDEVFRTHAQAHINAANLLGNVVDAQMIRPLREQIAALQAQLVESSAYSEIPREQQQRLIEQYPSLSGITDPKARASVMRDMLRGNPLPKGNQSHERYVESTMSAAPVKQSLRAAQDAFDALPTNKQEHALGAMLAQRGLSSLGLSQ